MTNDQRFNRAVHTAEALERAFPGRGLTIAASADAVAAEADMLTLPEVRAWNRERSLAHFDRHVPGRYRGARADHPDVTAWVENFLATKGACDSLMLQGDLGTGKTWQAYGALRAIAEAGTRPVHWRATTAPDLYAGMRGLSGPDAEAAFDRYAEAELLLLDDLGSAKVTGFVEEITFRLVNRRYSEQLPTIITTNVGTGNLADMLGERTESRLVEMCATWVSLRGDDRRFG